MRPEALAPIAAACDRLLQDPRLGPECLALPWLHFHSNHPLCVMHYEFLEAESALNRPAASVWGQVGHLLKTEVAAIARSWQHYRQVEASLIMPSLPDPGTVDALIISWLVNLNHLEWQPDFYFGDLQARLAQRGCSSLLVLRNQTGHPAAQLLARAYLQEPWPRIMLAEDRPAIARLGMIWRCLAAQGQLNRAYFADLSLLEQKIATEAARLLLTPMVLENLWLQQQVADLCRRLRPRVVITLYEGHAWERCVWQAARRVRPQVLCVGYQHTVLLQGAHAVKRSLGGSPACDPDLIWTLGDVTRRMLAASPKLAGVKLSTLGTHRRQEIPLAAAPRSLPVFLVLPEGLASECLCLFNFAIACAQRLPQVQFIFRNHPVFAFETIAAQLTGYDPNSGQIHLSRDRSLAEDFQRAGYLLYRGSSTAIYGILAGLKPFYLAPAGELNRDPLFELSIWREEVATVEQLVDSYHRHQAQPPAARLQEWQQARDYCQGYSQPIQEQAIAAMLALAPPRK